MSRAVSKLPLWSLKMATKISGRPTGVSEELRQSVISLGCIFIHIPKCAGNAVQKSLFGKVVFGHQTIRQYQLAFTSSEYRKACKFTITRDPFERIVSAWRFLRAGGFHKHDAKFYEDILSHLPSFDHFVNEWLVHQDLDRCGCVHFKPQVHYIREFNGSIPMNHIVKMSNLAVEYENLRSRFGGGSLVVDNQSRDSTTDCTLTEVNKETLSAISSLYSEDYEQLGYPYPS
jgi:hypothetical protein